MCMAPGGLYGRTVVPWLINGACSLGKVTKQRLRVVPEASGTVLEVGIGSALNLPLYRPERIERVIGIDPSPGLLARGRARVEAAPFPVELIEAPAEAMPVDGESVDTVVMTYTLCSLSNIDRAMAEIRRVLKPTGTLLFCEHGRADAPRVARFQDRLNPIWRRLSGGCNLNRRVSRVIENAGFQLTFLDTYALPAVPRFVGFHYVGKARVR